MYSYFNKYYLLNSNYKPVDTVDENSPLYTYEYICLGETKTEYEVALFDYYKLCQTGLGIYNQYPEIKGTHEDYMSHDQLTTLCNFSYKKRLTWHNEVWDVIKSQGFKYDNINTSKPTRWLHPRDIIYIAYLNRSMIGYLLFPLLFILMVHTQLKTYKIQYIIDGKHKDMLLFSRIMYRIKNGVWPTKLVFEHTDGKLLNYTRFETCSDRTLMTLVKKLIGRYDKLKYWFGVYFPKGHPINELLKDK
jgi:hypothetical protein